MLLGNQADQVEHIPGGQFRQRLAFFVDHFLVVAAGAVQAEEAGELQPRAGGPEPVDRPGGRLAVHVYGGHVEDGRRHL